MFALFGIMKMFGSVVMFLYELGDDGFNACVEAGLLTKECEKLALCVRLTEPLFLQSKGWSGLSRDLLHHAAVCAV